MAIVQTTCTSFKKELLMGTHDFSSDTFKIALYVSTATLGAATTAYTSTGETTGTGYNAGGGTLTAVTPTNDGEAGIADFADITFSTATLTARGALIYNSSKSNKAVCVLDFGSDRIKTAADFVITFPAADQFNAIIRVK
tara:strand:- start:393 stop:812 length:420 start_codon:yes stop_codon:yes gene_type:complete